MTRVFVRLPSTLQAWWPGVQVCDLGGGIVRVRLHASVVQPPEATNGTVDVPKRDVYVVRDR